MNKAEKIKAEIERRKNQFVSQAEAFHKIGKEDKESYYAALASNMNSLSCLLDTLEEDPVSNDLEEASYNWVMNNYGNPKESLFTFDQRCFIAGAQWQKEQMVAKACDWLADNYSKYIITNGLSTIFSATIDFDTIRMIEAFKKAMEE